MGDRMYIIENCFSAIASVQYENVVLAVSRSLAFCNSPYMNVVEELRVVCKNCLPLH